MNIIPQQHGHVERRQPALKQYPAESFYNNLNNYRPICKKTSQQSARRISQQQIQNEQQQQYYPYFLINKGWWKSLICIVILNCIFVLAFTTFVLDTRVQYEQNGNDPSKQETVRYGKSRNYLVMRVLCVVSLVFIDITYAMTQFLNPGIRNLSTIKRQQFQQANKTQFCSKCSQYRTEEFVHCSECQVCIWKYDHHCGFFSKCIGGRIQTYFFYGFMASIIVGFVTLLICMSIELGSW